MGRGRKDVGWYAVPSGTRAGDATGRWRDLRAQLNRKSVICSVLGVGAPVMAALFIQGAVESKLAEGATVDGISQETMAVPSHGFRSMSSMAMVALGFALFLLPGAWAMTRVGGRLRGNPSITAEFVPISLFLCSPVLMVAGIAVINGLPLTVGFSVAGALIVLVFGYVTRLTLKTSRNKRTDPEHHAATQAAAAARRALIRSRSRQRARRPWRARIPADWVGQWVLPFLFVAVAAFTIWSFAEDVPGRAYDRAPICAPVAVQRFLPREARSHLRRPTDTSPGRHRRDGVLQPGNGRDDVGHFRPGHSRGGRQDRPGWGHTTAGRDLAGRDSQALHRRRLLLDDRRAPLRDSSDDLPGSHLRITTPDHPQVCASQRILDDELDEYGDPDIGYAVGSR
jgi:hypothetical protein